MVAGAFEIIDLDYVPQPSYLLTEVRSATGCQSLLVRTGVGAAFELSTGVTASISA